MKKIIIILTVLFTWVLLMPSCDIVEEPYLVPAGSSGPGPGPGEAVRKVLLEDYTGHKCPNCPEAAVLAKNLKLGFKEQLVLLTVHAGFYSTPDATGEFTMDLRSAEGSEIHDYYGFYAYPSGLVNRTEYKGNKILFISDWEGAVQAEVDKAAQATIELSTTYDEGTRNLTCKAETEFLENLSGTYSICIFITESEIESAQKDEQGIIEDYIHNHVLRASMNGAWGEPVGANGTALVGEVQENEYSYVLPAGWVAAHCGIVAFVYDQDTREVIQAEELELSF